MANRIYIQVDYQDDNAQKQIDQINSKIAAIGTTSTQATAQATRGVQTFSVAIDQAQTHVDSLAQAITGMGIGEAIRQMITLGDQMNRAMAAMDQMAGGADGIAKLSATADAFGLHLAEVTQAANRLRNAGLGMKDIVPIIQAIGAYSVVAGGNIQENFTRAIESVALVANKRFITVKGLVDQMGAIGVQVLPLIQKAVNAQTGLNESINQVRENMRDVGVMPLLKAITDGADQAAIAAKKIADNSPVAEFIRTENAAQHLSATITQVLGPGIEQLLVALKPLVDLLTSALEAFNKLPEPIKNTTVLLIGLAAAVRAVNAALALTAALTGGGVIGGLVKGIGAAATAMGEFLVGAGEITTVLGGTVALATGWGEIAAVIAAAAAGVFALYQWTKKLIDEKKNATAAPPDKMGDQGSMTEPDLDKIQKEREQAANALSEAQKRYDSAALQGIAAVAAEYEVLYRTVTKVADAEALATAQKALELNVATEVLKHSQEMHKENIKAAEEDAAVARKIAVARATVVPDDSFAGRRDIAQLTAEEEQKQIEEQSALKINEQRKVTADQIANIQTLAQAGKISQEAAIVDRKNAEMAFTEFYIDQSKLATDKGQEATLKAQRIINELIMEEHRQLQDELLQDSLATIQQETNLRIAYVNATQTHTVNERLQQIKTVQDAEIAAIEKTRDAQVAAAREALNYYILMHPGGAGVTEEQEKFDREVIRLNQAAQAQMQTDRIKAWQEGNEAVIAQQKQVYDSIEELAGGLFDALTSKTKSVWAAVGDFIKNTLLSAIKSVVTSQLAAQLTQAFGFGQVGFAPSGIMGRVPVFSGMGAAPQPAAISTNLNYGTDLLGLGTSSNSSSGSANRSSDQVIADARTAGAIGSGGSDLPNLPLGTVTDNTSLDLSGYAAYGGGGSTAGYGGIATGTAGGAAKLAGGALSPAMQLNSLKNLMNIGKPININGTVVPWSQAPASAQMSAIAHSPGAGALETTVGMSLLMGGLQRKGAAGAAETISGGALTGVGIATMFPAIGLSAAGGALGGLGVGLLAAGLVRGGGVGLGMDVLGGAALGATIGSLVPGIGTLIGAGIGAAAGAVAGLVRMAFPGKLQQAHDLLQQTYGIDIKNQSILQQVVDIANQKYGGDLRLAVFSPDVMDIARAYALASGQSQAGLPRPMYSATFAQSQAGGLQLQPVYSGGQLVANPYTGATTQQVANAMQQTMFMQLNPQQAVDLFTGKVVSVVQSNPGVVAQANTTAAQSGQSRQAQAAALMEPATVLR
jgi:hypothetical protein